MIVEYQFPCIGKYGGESDWFCDSHECCGIGQ
jgi:hypothetical protein